MGFIPHFFFLSALFSFLFFGCISTPKNVYLQNRQSPALYGACLGYLSGDVSILNFSERNILEELLFASRTKSDENYFIGEIVFDIVSKEGRHLQLDRFGRLEYFRSQPADLNAKEGMEFLCAEHIRWMLERQFRETADILKKDPTSEASRQRADKNLKDYIQFSVSVKEKSQVVRNFLFLQLNVYLSGDKGFPLSPCGFSGMMREPIRIATKDLTDPSVKLAWASLIQSIAAYELGFTLAGYCNSFP